MKRRVVRIVDVSPRDGLQAVKHVVLPTERKIELVLRLVRDAGVRELDVASFVSPKVMPQLADGADVLAALRQEPDMRACTLTCLAPNERGAERALRAGATNLSIWVHGSEAFSERNLRMSTAEHMEANRAVVRLANAEDGVSVRGYVSGAIHCPFSGPVSAERVGDLSRQLVEELAVEELILADTLGLGTLPEVQAAVMAAARASRGEVPLGLHLHNTYGRALSLVAAGVQHWGIDIVEGSVAGLGGCPFAGPQSLGNTATEDIVHMLDQMGYETGVSVDGLLSTGAWICGQLGLPSASFLSRVQ